MTTVEPYSRTEPPHIAIVLMNLGTPDEPTPKAVRRYLREFLSDTRVIEIPMFLWQIILNLVVLPSRSKKVAESYKHIWNNGSPIRNVLAEQVNTLNYRWDGLFSDCKLTVHGAMTYGNPSVKDVLGDLTAKGCDNIIVVPLFPQYSSTSTGAACDAVTLWSVFEREVPNITIVKDYYKHPLYIQALANSVRNFQREYGKPEKLLITFHGIPKSFEKQGDKYPTRCRRTAQLLAQELGLKDNEWLCSFQSRFGPQEWVRPYTDEVLQEWGSQGVKSVQVIAPSFSADCLETLEELMVENRDNFINAGGKAYAYIPALNASDDHIELLEALILPLVEGWVKAYL